MWAAAVQLGAEAKYLVTRVGTRCSARTIQRLNSAVNYLAVGQWMKEREFVGFPRFDRRDRVFEYAARPWRDQPVLYLEFGVWKGDSLRVWSELLRHPESVLHGFDTFEGLPERWNLQTGRGQFSTDGAVPEIDDPRVTFFKGLFEDTLLSYEPPRHDRLIVNVDSDLYSSAATVLRSLEDRIVPGTLLYFDEFNDRTHELKAFDEFLERTGTSFRVVAANTSLANVMFERVA